MAWASYDVASSAYFGVAPAVLMPIYFREVFASAANPNAAWGMVASLAVLASSIAAVLAASLARRIPRFMLMVAFSAGLVAAIAALALNPWGSGVQAALGFIAAQSCYFAAMTLYESYLPDLTQPADRQKLSGFGWGIGYLGGILAIVVLLLLVAARPASLPLLDACFAALAVISAVLFAIVLTLMWRSGFGRLAGAVAAPQWRSVMGAIRHWRAYRGVFQLLLGTMLVQVAITVVVTFTAPILASRSGQSLQDLLWLLLLIHVLSVPSTLVWSALISNWSRLVPMTALLCLWGLVLLLLAFGGGPWMPVATVSVIGCCVGATSSALRGFLAESVGPGDAAAFFGLATVAGRMSAATGPLLYSALAVAAGERVSLIVVLAVLACGAVLVLKHLLDRPLPAMPRPT